MKKGFLNVLLLPYLTCCAREKKREINQEEGKVKKRSTQSVDSRFSLFSPN
jgi:hypothetical protein